VRLDARGEKPQLHVRLLFLFAGLFVVWQAVKPKRLRATV
jgi:hypothetical protein